MQYNKQIQLGIEKQVKLISISLPMTLTFINNITPEHTVVNICVLQYYSVNNLMYEIHVEVNKKKEKKRSGLTKEKGGRVEVEGGGGKKSLEICIDNKYYSFILNLFDSRRNCCTVRKMSSFSLSEKRSLP